MQYLSINRVRCSHNTTPSVQARVDACFSNRNSVLFHYFMNSNSINIRHFVEFIDANNTSISEDHGSCFKASLSCFLVSCHCRGETNARTSTASCRDSEWSCSENETKHL